MDGEGISDGLSAERKLEIIVRKNGRKDEVIVEKSAAKGLPKGWIKKLVITNRRGRKGRRDPFFIDPKGEYIFQSFKGASRYVETGDVGIYARKLKESDIEDDGSRTGKISSPLEPMGKRSAGDLLEKEKRKNVHVKNCKRRYLSSSKQSGNCKTNSNLCSVTSQALKYSGKKEQAKDPIEKQPMAKRVTRSQAKACETEDEADINRKKLSSSITKSEGKTSSNLSSVTSQVLKDSGKKEQAKDPIEKQPMAKRVTRSQAKACKTEDEADIKRKKLSSSITKLEGKTSSNLSSVTSQVLKDSGKKEQAKDPIEKQPMAKRVTRSQAKACETEDEADINRKKLSSSITKSEEDSVKFRLSSASLQAPEKEPIMKEAEVQKSTEKQMRSEAKVKRNELGNSVVRRASKRLAGIELEPMLELKTRTKAQRMLPPDDGRAGKEVAKINSEYSSPNKAAAETPVGISELELKPVFLLDGYKQNEEMSPVSPLSCQTSATKCVKTETSKRFRQSSPKTKLMSSVKVTKKSYFGSLNKSKCPRSFDSGNAVHKRNKSGKELSKSTVVRGACSELMEKNTNVLSSTFDSTLADLWNDPCIAFAIETLTGESLRHPSTAAISFDPKNNYTKQKGVSFLPETLRNVKTSSENPEFTTASSVEDIWKDPCIDFAIKALTGAIPIRLDEEGAKSKSEEIKIGKTAMQEAESRQSNCDYFVQQCNMKNKTVGKSADLTFTQSQITIRK